MLRPFAPAAILLAFAGSPAFAQQPDAAPAAPPAVAAPPAQTIIVPAPGQTIYDELKASGRFTTLVKALDGSGLTPLLQRPGGFTLFAPTDDAFKALPPATLADLMKPDNSAKLQQLLAYHLVNTKIAPDQVVGHTAAPVPSVINKPITLDGASGTIHVNDATVLQPGVPASNGVIYVIDKVLTPPQ